MNPFKSKPWFAIFFSSAVLSMMMLMTINAQAAGIEVTPAVNVADADFVAGKKAIEAKD